MANKDKNMMRDPSTANCRIYIGNLDKAVSEEELQNVFSAHGKIRGIMIQRNFGFIQFETEQAAQQAIQKQAGSLLQGKKLIVKAVITNNEGGKGNPKIQQNQQQQQQQPPVQTPPATTVSSPPITASNPIPVNTVKSPETMETETTVTPKSSGPAATQSWPKRPRGGGMGNRGGRGGGPQNSQMRGGFRDRSPLNKDRDNYGRDRDNYGRDDPYPGGYAREREPYPASMPPTPLPRRKANCNDCEIIVVAKSLTEYAEYIENRLKSLGITVDLLFPNEDVPIGRVLANIASRGCLYAILVTPQNEERRSLTLNILHGMPEEHRNMPTDDAISLLSRNFDAYIRGEKSVPGSATLGALSERHPEPVQILLNLLAENRQLTVLQYDRLIKYLQERRELQLKHELGDAADDIDTAPNSKKAAELQNRILSILNSTPSTQTSTETSVGQKIKPGAPSPIDDNNSNTSNPSSTVLGVTPASSAPLLNDPSVQKALDSLLQADLLKNIVKPASTALATPVSPTSPIGSTNSDNYGTNYSSNVRRF